MTERVTWDLSTLQGDTDNIIIRNNRIITSYEDEYLGKVNDIITIEDLISKLDITEGTNNMSGDITWLKFRTYDGNEILVADRNVRHSISYTHLESKGIVKTISNGYNPLQQGQIIEIDGNFYKCRLLTGGNANPASIGGGEWDRFIVRLVSNNTDSNWSGIHSWCQEVYNANTAGRVLRGYRAVGYFGYATATITPSYYGFRPVLEAL